MKTFDCSECGFNNEFHDSMYKDMFWNALKLNSNKKIPRKIAQQVINDNVKLFNNLCHKNDLPLFNSENTKSEYILIKNLKKMNVLFLAKTVLIKKEYELTNNVQNNTLFKKVEFISKLVKLRELFESLFNNSVRWIVSKVCQHQLWVQLYCINSLCIHFQH